MRKLFILKNYLFHEKEHHDIHDMMLHITDSFKEELLCLVRTVKNYLLTTFMLSSLVKHRMAFFSIFLFLRLV